MQSSKLNTADNSKITFENWGIFACWKIYRSIFCRGYINTQHIYTRIKLDYSACSEYTKICRIFWNFGILLKENAVKMWRGEGRDCWPISKAFFVNITKYNTECKYIDMETSSFFKKNQEIIKIQNLDRFHVEMHFSNWQLLRCLHINISLKKTV